MARDTRKRFLDALKKHDRAIYRAFIDAMTNAANGVNMGRLERALETGNVDEVLRAMGFGPQAMDGMQEAIRQAFQGGAAYHIATAPKAMQGSLEVAFQGYHPRIIQWMERNAAARVAEIAEDARKVIRQTIATGMQEQRGYKKISLDLVGRMDGNRRKGGVIGLLEREAGYVANARRQLEDLDPAYFSRKLRDRRFDKTIERAIREGKPVPASVIDNATSRYSSRLLAERGRRISRAEGNRAMAAGRDEHMRQMIDRGDMAAEDVTGTWRHTARPGHRDNHAAMNGETRKYGERYSNGMLRPHEEGAPASEVVNCACVEVFATDWVAIAKRRGTY